MTEYTTIRISKKLLEKLKEYGKKKETYEDVIWRLLREVDANNKNRNL